MITTILIFIIVLGLLIFVHELGHFIAAKRSGMRVDEFGFGFPPRLFGIQKSGGKWRIVWGHRQEIDQDATVYSINWIPLGGFVKIAGENNELVNDPTAFSSRPFGSRLITLLAGVLMNFILAWILISAGLVAGLPAAVDDPAALTGSARLENSRLAILEVLPGQPADRGGLRPGDTLLSIDDKFFSSSQEASRYIIDNAGKSLAFFIRRGQQELQLTVDSQLNPKPGQGPTGIALSNVGELSYPWYLAPWEGLRATALQTSGIASGLWSLFSGEVGIKALGGPVKIAQLTGEVSRMGFSYLLQFTAFLSINLGLLNILPFPALDGGRIMFLLIEKIRGKKNNQKAEQWANTLGFVLLILLMIFITANDILNLFS